MGKMIKDTFDIEFKKSFLLINFKNTQDIRSQHVGNIEKTKNWFLTVYTALYLYVLESDISLLNSIFILFVIGLLFWLISLNSILRKQRVSFMIRKFEKFIMNLTNDDISNMNGPLLDYYKLPTKAEDRKIVKSAITSWKFNDIYWLTVLLTTILLIFIKLNE